MILFVAMSLVASAAVFYIVSIVIDYYERKDFYDKAETFYGPKALPFIGNAHLFSVNTSDIFNTFDKLLSQYPLPLRIWLGNRLLIGINDPDHVKTVLLSPKALEKTYLLDLVHSWLGTGLFTAPVDTWRPHRKLILPAFNTGLLESFAPVTAQKSIIMINELEKRRGEALDLYPVVALCAVDSLCEAFLGVTMDVQTSKHRYYIEATSKGLEILSSRLFNVWQHSDLIFNFTKAGKELNEHLKYFNDFTEEILQKRKEKYKKESATELPNSNEIRKRRRFLDLLLNLNENEIGFNENDIRDEIRTLLLANDSTAVTSTFLSMMLAKHPDIQEKIYQELYGIYGSSDPEVAPTKYEHLGRMEYLERAVKESLRLFPVAHAVMRQTTDDLEIGKWVIPKGASILIPTFHIHRDPRYWPDPLKFDPDRFLPEYNEKRHPGSYIPFNLGPRNCVGKRHAMLTQKIIMSTLLRRYRLKLDSDLDIEKMEFKTDITLKTKEPVKIRLERRISA